MNKKTNAITAIFAMLTVSLSLADVVNVNFGSEKYGDATEVSVSGSGQGPITYTGTNWNNFFASPDGEPANLALTDLSDSEGNPTSIDIDIGHISSYSYDEANLPVVAGYLAFDRDYGDGDQAARDITISGLENNSEYNIAWLGHGNNVAQAPVFTFNGVSKTNDVTDVEATTWVEGDNYSTYTLTSDGTGEITGSWIAIDGERFAGIGGVQIELVPEPATLGIVALFGALALLRRRMGFTRK